MWLRSSPIAAVVLALAAQRAAAQDCTANGQPGECISTSSCAGTSTPGLCPGAADIQCCTYGTCTASGVSGSCQPSSTCTGTTTAGLCPGDSDILCCTSGDGGGGGGDCGVPEVNQATVDLVKEFEGYEPNPYDDPTGHETVGYGHLCTQSGCTEVPYPFPLSEAEAAQLLQSDMKSYTTCAANEIGVELNANQFGALASWTYNVGCGNMETSTLVKRLNAGEDPNTVAAEELPKWNKSNGQVLPGLTRRRAAEVELFQTATSEPGIC